MVITPKDVNSVEKLSGGRIKGGMLKAHLEWVRQYHGDEGVKRVINELPPQLHSSVAQILPTAWIPFETIILVDKAIERIFSRRSESFLKELGMFSAHLNLSTTYRLYRSDSIHDFFRRSALLHSQFQDFGTALYEKTGETAGTMTHRDYTCFSPLYCASALGYYEQAVVEHGARSAHVAETTCQCRGDATCTFELQWS